MTVETAKWWQENKSGEKDQAHTKILMDESKRQNDRKVAYNCSAVEEMVELL
jgi:hypothetical protein